MKAARAAPISHAETAGSWQWFALLVALVIAAYFPALRGEFIWDDDDYVENNFTLRSLTGLGQIWSDPSATPQYYPLVHSSFWLEYQLAGLNTTVYHTTNVLLHALNAWLLGRLLARVGIPGAFLASAIFALHPVAVESVAWITERKNVLSLCFYLTAFSVYWPIAREDQYQRTASNGWLPASWGGWRYAAALACYAAALLSKTVACSLPAAILLVIYLVRGTIRRVDLTRLAPFFLLGLPLALNTARLERLHVGAYGPEFELGFLNRICIAGRAIWFYLGKLVWPWPVAFSYERWDMSQPTAVDWLYPLAAIGVLGLLYYQRQRWGRGTLVAALFFGGTLLPALGFVNVYPFRYSFVADHFQYHAMLGPIALAAALIYSLAARWRWSTSRAQLVVVTIVVLAFGSLTWLQAHDYRDLNTLYVNTIAKSPRAWLAWHNLSTLRTRQGLHQESLRLLEEAVRLRPIAPDVRANYGATLLELGRIPEAQEQFTSAMQLWPESLGRSTAYVQAELGLTRCLVLAGDLKQAHPWLQAMVDKPATTQAAAYGLAVLAQMPTATGEPVAAVTQPVGKLAEKLENEWRTESGAWAGFATAMKDLGQLAPAAEAFRRAAALDGGDACSWNDAITFYAAVGQLDHALETAREFAKRCPQHSSAQFNHGSILAMRGQLIDATAAFRRGLQLDPNSAEGHANLAQALMLQGQSAAAVAELRAAHELDPGNEAVTRQYAWILAAHPSAEIRRPQEAIQLASQMLAASGMSDPRWLDVLGTAQAASGDFSKAIVTIEQAIQVASAVDAKELVAALAERKRLFVANQPYSDTTLLPASATNQR